MSRRQCEQKKALSLEDQWNEHLSVFHVIRIFGSELFLVFFFFYSCCSIQRDSYYHCQQTAQRCGLFEKNAPTKEQQRRIQWVTDMAVKACFYQPSSFFHTHKRGVVSTWIWFANLA